MLCFSSSYVPHVAKLSGFSIFWLPFGIFKRLLFYTRDVSIVEKHFNVCFINHSNYLFNIYHFEQRFSFTIYIFATTEHQYWPNQSVLYIVKQETYAVIFQPLLFLRKQHYKLHCISLHADTIVAVGCTYRSTLWLSHGYINR